jgi:hypothetical protein
MKIERRQNVMNMTWEYKITILWFIFYRTLTKEQIIFNNFPFWFKFSNWLFILLCPHKWEKIENWFNFASYYNKEYKCKNCGLVRQFWYRNLPKE